MAFAWNFFGIFIIFFFFFFLGGGGLWGKSIIGTIYYLGAKIFPVVRPVSGTEALTTAVQQTKRGSG